MHGSAVCGGQRGRPPNLPKPMTEQTRRVHPYQGLLLGHERSGEQPRWAWCRGRGEEQGWRGRGWPVPAGSQTLLHPAGSKRPTARPEFDPVSRNRLCPISRIKNRNTSPCSPRSKQKQSLLTDDSISQLGGHRGPRTVSRQHALGRQASKTEAGGILGFVPKGNGCQRGKHGHAWD